MKLIFFLSIALYLTLAIFGAVDRDYIDVQKKKQFFDSILIYLILVSVIIGGAYFIWFTRVFPKGFTNQSMIGKILLAVAFIVLSFALNRGALVTCNTFDGGRETVMIQGIVLDKYLTKHRRSTSYYLVIADTLNRERIKLAVSKRVYNSGIELNQSFTKEFRVGLLGIIYRNKI